MAHSVTEDEWLEGPPRRTVVKVRRLVDERRRLLALCAMFGLYRDNLTRPGFAAAVDLMERFADGTVGDAHRMRALGLMKDFDWSSERLSTDDAQDLQWISQCFLATEGAHGDHRIPMLTSITSEASLLRDIFGNPFRPVSFNSDWRTSNVVSLAKSMYESRDFATMPILSDALQDAGCEHEAILDHCGDANGSHVRGCWVVDLILEKS
jgi:hypothetical protein